MAVSMYPSRSLHCAHLNVPRHVAGFGTAQIGTSGADSCHRCCSSSNVAPALQPRRLRRAGHRVPVRPWTCLESQHPRLQTRLRALEQPLNSIAVGDESEAGREPQPAPRVPPPGGWSPGGLWKLLLQRLSSFPLAIGELAVTAGLCAVGTIIEQNETVEHYMEKYPDGPSKVLGFLDYHIILGAQLDHIYTAPYFVGLLTLLAASLAACTYTRQLPMVRVAKKWRFPSSAKSVLGMGSKDCAYVVPDADARDLGRLLRKSQYQVFYQGGDQGGALYGFKGLAGRIGPIFVHASMLLIIAGVSYGAFCGFKGQVMVPEGLEFTIGDRLVPKSPLAAYPAGAYSQLHVNSFEVRYRDDGSVAQFYSDLSVFDPEGRERVRKVISVNDPLRYKGVTAYQTDYSMAAVTVRAEGSPLQPPGGEPFNLPLASMEGQAGVKGRAWATFIPAEMPKGDGTKPRGVALVARDFQLVVLYNSDGSFAGVRRVGSGKPIEVEGLKITVDNIIGSTGLELKSDPGVPIVYAGFGALMIATLVSYLSHSQVWAFQEGSALHVSGRSNRATIDFKAELQGILEEIPERDRQPAEAAVPEPAGPGPLGTPPPTAEGQAS